MENHSILKKVLSAVFKVLSFIAIISFLCSCNTYKTVPYFHDLPDTTSNALGITVPFKNPTIQPDDILSINIGTLDQDINSFLNKTASITTPSGSPAVPAPAQQDVPGYLVDKNGEIELPFVGKIKLLGLTTSEAKDSIKSQVSKYFKQPVVSVRFANFKVTVLGEVARPATYIVPNEKINILDVLGMAGDVTIYGKKENVLLVRDTLNGNKKMTRLNVDSKNIVSSPYFYLRPNDIIYVEPNKYKTTQDEVQRNRNIITVTVSLAAIIVARILR